MGAREGEEWTVVVSWSHGQRELREQRMWVGAGTESETAVARDAKQERGSWGCNDVGDPELSPWKDVLPSEFILMPLPAYRKLFREEAVA